jgi:hypothetical protein
LVAGVNKEERGGARKKEPTPLKNSLTFCGKDGIYTLKIFCYFLPLTRPPLPQQGVLLAEQRRGNAEAARYEEEKETMKKMPTAIIVTTTLPPINNAPIAFEFQQVFPPPIML